ncbi:hypothetical protein NQ152_08545 [Microbacterium sp. zg.B48]|uniref:hypothetical protein n=1 Tax=unclassified Microbacterium TaxID=2609290 RepID=UPI00214C2396|nr:MULTISPECIES: hypothetical protein [unclassified Microbacterium]MCR2763557.1 hypothetical protein [Microbacterium sp. zg.B48]MCR2809279.1 hypothetical protein [Microbacterium sp. zg.B185]WIM20422.1 hypothetical protein QNO12_06395 [Microbacterium sp. zg-B185]
METDPLPPSVNDILECVGAAAAPSGHVPRREEDQVKADMMNVRERWMPVDPRAFQIKCYEAGLTSQSAGALVGFLRHIQRGGSLRPRDSAFRFPQSPESVNPGEDARTPVGQR